MLRNSLGESASTRSCRSRLAQRSITLVLASLAMTGCLLDDVPEDEQVVNASAEDSDTTLSTRSRGNDTDSQPPVQPAPPPANSMSVVSTDPGAENFVQLEQAIRVTFSGPVNPATVNSNSFQILGPQGPISGSISVNGSTVTFAPSSSLIIGTAYNAVAEGSITDADGNALSADYTWSFSTAFGDTPPLLAQWEAEMIEFGHQNGEFLNPINGKTAPERGDAQYYDATWVFYQIADYTGDSQPWTQYAEFANRWYLNEYLEPNEFKAQGYRRFPHGLLESFERGVGGVTLSDIELLRDKPAYSFVRFLRTTGGHEVRSREVAYAAQANIIAEKAGAARAIDEGAPTLSHLVPFMGSHMYEWRTKSFEGGTGSGRVAPFMVGLTTHALIEFYEWETENGRDPNTYWHKTFPLAYHDKPLQSRSVRWDTILEAIEDTLTYLHDEATMQSHPDRRLFVTDEDGYGAFRYEDIGDSNPAPDLNMLIAPSYAWLYFKTGNEKYRGIADKLFGSAVQNAYLKRGKIFNQNYRRAFEYLQWRQRGDELWNMN